MQADDGASPPLQDYPRRNAALKVFEAAKDLFYKRGVNAVGIEEIVRAAGVTKPSLYRAYKSKDDLIAACLADNIAEDASAMQAAIAAAGTSPHSQLRAAVAHYAARIGEPSFRGCLSINIGVEISALDHPCQSLIENGKRDRRAVMCGLAKASGAHEAENLADSILLLIEGAMASFRQCGGQSAALTLVRTADLVIDGHTRIST